MLQVEQSKDLFEGSYSFRYRYLEKNNHYKTDQLIIHDDINSRVIYNITLDNILTKSDLVSMDEYLTAFTIWYVYLFFNNNNNFTTTSTTGV